MKSNYPQIFLVFTAINFFTLLTVNVFAQYPVFRPYFKNSYVLTDKNKKIIVAVFPDYQNQDRINSRIAYNLMEEAKRKLANKNAEIEKEEKTVTPAVKDSDGKIITPETVVLNTANANNTKINTLNDERDVIAECIKLLSGINRLTGRPKLNNAFFSIRNPVDAELFYEGLQDGGVSLANSFTIQGSKDRGVVNTDLVTGYLGPFRLSFNTVFLATKDTSTKLNTVEKLFNGGGLATVNIRYPWIYFQRTNFIFASQFSPKFAGDFPAFGNEIAKSDFVGYADIGNEIYLQVNDKDGKFSLFTNFKIAKIYGTSSFYNNIQNANKGSFWIGQIYSGFKITDKFVFGVNIPLFASDNVVNPKTVSVGITLFPSFSNKLAIP